MRQTAEPTEVDGAYSQPPQQELRHDLESDKKSLSRDDLSDESRPSGQHKQERNEGFPPDAVGTVAVSTASFALLGGVPFGIPGALVGAVAGLLLGLYNRKPDRTKQQT